MSLPECVWMVVCERCQTNNTTLLFQTGMNIFELDRLIIPVNADASHWFVICVFFQEQKIQAYDTSPAGKKGEIKSVRAVYSYLNELSQEIYGEELERWKLCGCGIDKEKIAPRQADKLNNCGIFTCLIMEMLINKIDPWVLDDYRLEVENLGRLALFHSLKMNKPILQNCFSERALTIQNCKNGPYKLERLFPLTSMLVEKRKLPYIEELAYHLQDSSTEQTEEDDSREENEYDDGKIRAEETEEDEGTKLPPLPLPEPWEFHFLPPKLNDRVEWSYDETRRIVVVNLTNVIDIHWKHKQYMGQIMERDDVTLIMEGLVSKLFEKMKDLNYLMEQLLIEFGDCMCSNFRRCDRVEEGAFVSYKAKSSFVSPMRVKDYVEYLKILMGENPDVPFLYINGNGEDVIFKRATDAVFYMLDLDMPLHLLRINAAFKSEFKMKEILTGGGWCMANWIRERLRTMMGPNSYISPGEYPILNIPSVDEISNIWCWGNVIKGGGETEWHGDGHGSVDSEHTNLHGYKEVVILRRLPEKHREYAMELCPMLFRTMPHARDKKSQWPTNSIIKKFKAMK